MASRISAAGEFTQLGSYSHTMLWWLVQLSVGVGVRLLRGGSTVELPLVAVPGSSLLNSKMPGIRHCSLILNKHMTNINGGDCKYNSR